MYRNDNVPKAPYSPPRRHRLLFSGYVSCFVNINLYITTLHVNYFLCVNWKHLMKVPLVLLGDWGLLRHRIYSQFATLPTRPSSQLSPMPSSPTNQLAPGKHGASWWGEVTGYHQRTHGPLKIGPDWFSILQLRRTAGWVLVQDLRPRSHWYEYESG